MTKLAQSWTLVSNIAVLCKIKNILNTFCNLLADEISIIDWEHSGHTIMPLEFLLLYENWIGETPSESYRREWVRAYLQTHPDNLNVTEDLVDVWYQDSIRGSVVSIHTCTVQTAIY